MQRFALKALSKKAVIERGQLAHVRDEKLLLQNMNHPLILELFSTFQVPPPPVCLSVCLPLPFSITALVLSPEHLRVMSFSQLLCWIWMPKMTGRSLFRSTTEGRRRVLTFLLVSLQLTWIVHRRCSSMLNAYDVLLMLASTRMCPPKA